MARRVVDDAVRDSYTETELVTRPSIASVIANVVTVAYVLVISIIGLDTLLRALGARSSNGFVHLVRNLASPLVAPFRTMFSNQRYWATALIAAVVYTIGYLIVQAALGRDRTT